MSESIKSDVQPQELNIASTPDEAVNAATTEFTEQNSINEETPQVPTEDATSETEVAKPASRQEIIERLQAIAQSDDALNSKAEVEALKGVGPNVAKGLARLDLTRAIDELLDDIGAGRKYMKVYRQMKMYNDADTNPVLYGATK